MKQKNKSSGYNKTMDLKKPKKIVVNLQEEHKIIKEENLAKLKDSELTSIMPAGGTLGLSKPNYKLSIHGNSTHIEIDYETGSIKVEGDWDEAAKQFMKKCAEIVGFKTNL